MEHMKRMLVIVAAVVVAGAALMYVHRNMYKNCGNDVQVQHYETTGEEDQDGRRYKNSPIQPG